MLGTIKFFFKEEFSWFEVIFILTISCLAQISLWWFLLVIPVIIIQGIGSVMVKEMEQGK